MNKFIFFVVFLTVGITITYFMIQPSEGLLPVINPVDLEPEMVDFDLLMERQGYGHTIGEFLFTNQDGETITNLEVDGKVYVAEYFFTTCKSICPIMNEQMQRVHKVYQYEKDLKILSYTVDPDVDTVEQMKRYADEHGANSNQWHFLTGTKENLYGLARKSYFVLKPAEAQNLGDAGSDFIHTNNFVLVDRKSRIRGYYDGTSPTSIDSLIHDIGRLLEEDL
ncbi:MAG: SCO family protein [Crocinitomicaceae bacterium]|nr:SCO family protein [Crocinitomicaceae bacterium]